jgi:hypothetical protein
MIAFGKGFDKLSLSGMTRALTLSLSKGVRTKAARKNRS